MDVHAAKRYMQDNYPDDWLAAINYMGNVIAKLFPASKQNKKRGYNNNCYISEPNTHARNGGGCDGD